MTEATFTQHAVTIRDDQRVEFVNPSSAALCYCWANCVSAVSMSVAVG
jgi:hypothetical protein